MNHYRSHFVIWLFVFTFTTHDSQAIEKIRLPQSKIEWCIAIPIVTYFAYYSIIKFKRPLTIDKLPPLETTWDYIVHAQIERDDIDAITNMPRYPAHGLGHVLSPLDKAGRIFISYIKMLYFMRELYNDIRLFSELFEATMPS